jgi:FkbM family methyltransferase
MFKYINQDEKKWAIFEKDNATIIKSKKIDFVRKDAIYIEKIILSLNTFENALDCGACYGFWTYLLQPYFKRIYAFELVNAHRLCFLKNMENFNINNYELFPFGLGDKNTKCAIANNKWAIQKFGYAAFNAQVLEDKNGKENLRTLDSLHLKNISFIKIDVEGYELNLLKGGYETIKNNRPVIFIERTITNYEELINFLFDLNYDIVEEFEKDTLFKIR